MILAVLKVDFTRKSRLHKKINPERQCNHCEWTRQGTQQVFVHHILGEIQGLRTQICKKVPADIKEKFRKAKSEKAQKAEASSNLESDDVVPVIQDETLSKFTDFPAEIWKRDTFIRIFKQQNKKSRVTDFTLMGMNRTFYTASEHHTRWTEITRPKMSPLSKT